MTNRGDFEELVRRHHALVYRTAWRLVRDDADAQDVAQEVFLRLARSPRDRAPLADARSPEAVLRWLAVRGALEHLRDARHRRDREEDYAMEHGPRRAGATPDEIAAFVATMLGPVARYLHGSIVYVDGGNEAAMLPDKF